MSAPASVLQVAAPSRAAGLRRRWPVLLGSGAVAAAFAAGLLVAPALGESAAPRPTPSPTGSDAGPFISGSSGTGSALGVFGEPQRDVDRPPIGVAAHLLPQTFRRMQAVPLRGVDVYAAEDSAGDICLVAVAVDARIAVTCTSIADWRKAPIRLEFPASAYLDTGVRVRDQVDLVATWGFLGPFDLQESPLSAGE